MLLFTDIRDAVRWHHSRAKLVLSMVVMKQKKVTLLSIGCCRRVLLLLFWLSVSATAVTSASSSNTARSHFPTPRTVTTAGAATDTSTPSFFHRTPLSRLRRRKKHHDDRGSNNNDDDNDPFRHHQEPAAVAVEEPDGMIDLDHDDSDNSTNKQQWTSKFWPPWPFVMLHHHGKEEDDHGQVLAGTTTNAAASGGDTKATTPGTSSQRTRPSMDYYSSVLAHVWSRSRRSARVAARNIQEVGSQLWYHLPPGAPPLLLLASWPHRHQQLLDAATATTAAAATATTTAAAAAPAIMTKKTVIPLLSNPFVRSIALSAAGLAFISWGHAELRQKRRLTALPLPERYRDINRAVLPPFLPAAVAIPPPPTPPSWYFSTTPKTEDDNDRDDATAKKEEQPEETTVFSPPRRLRRYWNDFLGNNTLSPRKGTTRSLRTGWRDLRYRRTIRQCERRNAHRLVVFDELVMRQQTLQKNNNKKTNRRKNNTSAAAATTGTSSTDLGYALVTGASKGIGRALAVELARWEIPLILVSRDADALAALAGDLETCYGISCYVVPADLAKDGTAQKLYRTVKKAGLKVDVSISAQFFLTIYQNGLAEPTSHSFFTDMTTVSDQQCRDCRARRRFRPITRRAGPDSAGQYAHANGLDPFVWTRYARPTPWSRFIGLVRVRRGEWHCLRGRVFGHQGVCQLVRDCVSPRNGTVWRRCDVLVTRRGPGNRFSGPKPITRGTLLETAFLLQDRRRRGRSRRTSHAARRSGSHTGDYQPALLESRQAHVAPTTAQLVGRSHVETNRRPAVAWYTAIENVRWRERHIILGSCGGNGSSKIVRNNNKMEAISSKASGIGIQNSAKIKDART
jgi:short chain dehydrogenase